MLQDMHNDGKRSLFSRATGGIDYQRLIEQMIPAVIVGTFIAFANAKVTEYQVGELTKKIDTTETETRTTQSQLVTQTILAAQQSERLTSIAAQMSLYLGQQTTINTAIDARLTFMERQSYLVNGVKK